MYCPYCGFQVQDNFIYCPKCGKSFGKSNLPSEHQNDSNSANSYTDESFFKRLGLFFTLLFKGEIIKPRGVLILALIFAFCFLVFRDKPDPSKEFNKVYYTVTDQSIPNQRAFNLIQRSYKYAIRKAKTELELAQINREYETEFNSFFKDRHIKNWFAKVDKIESVFNGAAAHVVLECDFPDARYKFETRNWGFLHIHVPSNTELYNRIVSLKSGDYVLFSGKLTYSDDGYGNKVIHLCVPQGDKNEKLLIKFSDISLVKAKE